MIFKKRKENEILKNILNTSNLSNSLQNLLGFEKKKKGFMCFDEKPC